MKQYDKLLKQVKANIAASTKKKKHLFTFKKEHYKEKLQSTQGFGYVDLKPTYLKLYLHLVKKYGAKLTFELVNASNHEVALYAK